MKKKIIAIGVSLCCVLSLIPVWPRNEVMAVEKNASFLGLDDVAPLDFNQADTLNPYGINQDEKKLLLTQNELLTFVSTRNASNDAYNKTYIKNGINTDSLSEDSNNVLTKSDTLHSETQIDSLSSSSFVKAVAFDATGSGRKNYVANLSVARINNVNKVFLTVHKIENNTYTNTKGIELGTIDWFGSKGIAECIADNFLQIESGDFNGDGIDELAVYASTDSNPGVRIYDSKLNLKQTMGIYHISYVSDGNSDADIKYKLNCSLASGDFDGNGTTDLAVCTGTNVRGSSSSESLSGSTALVSVWQNMGSVLGKSYQYELSNPQSAGSNKYNVIHSATITMGDVDNDGQDEIIAAGYLNTDVDCSGGGCSNLYDFNDTFFGLCNISIGGSATVELVQMPQAIKSGLKFDHKTNDKIKVPMNVKCVAINGTKSAELVYITGCLYDLSSMSPSLVLDTMGDSLDLYHLGYVKVFSQNATVGVFDDNKAGREQVVFALGVKKPNDNRYSYSIVMIGAKEVDGASKYYYISQNDVLVDENDDLQSAGDGGLNCVPLAVDTDDDGVMVRYSGKGYSYTDPQVTTILQAAPYFSELGTFDDFNNGATTYTVESTYEIGSQSSNSVSFGTSVGGSAEVIGNEISVEAGFAMDWDEDFEDSVQTTYSSTFMAGAYDTIVIQRTPQTTYTYELYDYANDKWSGTYYCVTVPMRPVFYQLSVEEYNLYAKEYNDTVTGSQLALVDSSILPENNEGNPSAYYSSWGSAGTGNKNLSNSTYALSYNAGSISSEWSEEVSHTAAISIEHGFNFTVSLSVGLEILDTGGTVDSSVSIAYSHGTGSYKTTTKAGGACGTVCGIDRAALINNGYDINAVTQYGFNWQFGTWSRNMLGDGKDIPVFGYVINNITRAANPITTLTAENNKDTDKAVTVSWDAPINDMNVTIQGYKVYRKSFDQESYTMVRDTASERTFTDKGLSTYLIYSYYVTAVYKDNDLNITYESIPSNIVTIIVAANETIDVHDGVDGADGTDGREIELYVDNGFIKWRYTGSADDNILIRISDLMGENGTNGINGADGISVKKASIDNDGYLVITYSNDYSENTGLVVGKDGIGIQDIRINSFGELYIVLTDNRVFNLGKIIGKDGKDGIDGKDGTNGLDGTNGTDGKDGTNGMDGNDGKDGTNGMDGNDGKDGINGTNGKDDSVGDNVTEVKDGKSGTNGSDGSDGHNGINGTNGVGISNLAVNRKGYLMVTLTDGSVINAGYVFTKEKVTTEYKTKTVMIYSAFAMSTASLTGNVIALVFQLLKRRKLGL